MAQGATQQSTRTATVLVVDDDDSFHRVIAKYLAPYERLSAYSPREALDLLAKVQVDVALLDVNLSCEVTGFHLLDSITRDYPATAVIMVTGFDTVRDAVRAIKAGAANYLDKSLENYETLATEIESILRLQGCRIAKPDQPEAWLDSLRYAVDQVGRLARSGPRDAPDLDIEVLADDLANAIRGARPLSYAERIDYDDCVKRFGQALVHLARSRWRTKREAARQLMLPYSTYKRKL